MSDPVDALILDLLEWIGREPRAYSEVMDAWRSSCPRLTVWEEDAHERGFVERRHREGRGTFISLTALGREFLRIGSGRDQLQLEFLHVGCGHRGLGWGRRLFALAAAEARRRGAKSLYISATPAARTIDFYLRLGCRVCSEPDPDLLALEPDDIHLQYALPQP